MFEYDETKTTPRKAKSAPPAAKRMKLKRNAVNHLHVTYRDPIDARRQSKLVTLSLADIIDLRSTLAHASSYR